MYELEPVDTQTSHVHAFIDAKNNGLKIKMIFESTHILFKNIFTAESEVNFISKSYSLKKKNLM